MKTQKTSTQRPRNFVIYLVPFVKINFFFLFQLNYTRQSSQNIPPYVMLIIKFYLIKYPENTCLIQYLFYLCFLTISSQINWTDIKKKKSEIDRKIITIHFQTKICNKFAPYLHLINASQASNMMLFYALVLMFLPNSSSGITLSNHYAKLASNILQSCPTSNKLHFLHHRSLVQISYYKDAGTKMHKCLVGLKIITNYCGFF